MKKYAGLLALLILALLAAWLEGINDPSDTTTPPVRENAQRPPQSSQPSRQPGVSTEAALPQGKGFDFYVLSLSWSPTWCQNNRDGNSESQCGAGRRFGFVVHGLWPQYEKGYPEFCASREQQRVPDSLGRPLLDIMPSMGLIGHQWRKHGSCSGLSQPQYLDMIRKAYDSITIPAVFRSANKSATYRTDEIEAAFTSANPGLERGGIAATCRGNRLEEIRICLTRDLKFRSCQEVDRQGCRSASLEIPPVGQY